MNTITAHTQERQWKIRQALYLEALDTIDGYFTALQTDYMPIKGAYLLRCGLAQHLACRRMDDIDILVKPEDFAAAMRFFSAQPGVEHTTNHWPFEASFLLPLGTRRVYIELHYQLNFPERFYLPANSLFSHAQAAGKRLYLPDPVDAMLILLCHALVHIGFEFRTEWFEEITLIGNQPSFSWETFWKRAPETGVEPFFQYMLICHAATKKCTVCLPAKRKTYPTFLARALPVSRHAYVPRIVRRLLMEIPFYRNIFGMLKQGAVGGTRDSQGSKPTCVLPC